MPFFWWQEKRWGQGEGWPWARSTPLQSPPVLSLRPAPVIIVHSGPRASGPRGPILPSLWEQLPGPRPQAQPVWPSAALSQGQMTPLSVAWSPRAPGSASSESIRQAPLPMGTSILIWKKLQAHEQSRWVGTGGRHTQLTRPPEEAQTQALSGSCVCGDPRGWGGPLSLGVEGGSCFPENTLFPFASGFSFYSFDEFKTFL